MKPGDQIRKVIGKAAHPDAVNRLLEIWPEAVASVRHFDNGYDNNGQTSVWIWPNEVEKNNPASPHYVVGVARVHPNDNRNRRYGLNLAFRRALSTVSAAWGQK